MKYLSLLALLYCNTAHTLPRLEKKIGLLQPKISPELKAKIATAVFMTSIKYNLRPKIMLAIIMQESSFRVDAVNCNKDACYDFGLTQINIITARAYGFDVARILSEPAYAIDCMGKILYDMKTMYNKKEPNYWTRYNASNPIKRDIYFKKVSKYIIH